MPVTLSPLADLVDHPQDVDDRTKVTPFGVCIHTTGRGVPALAKKLGTDPLAVAVDIYCAPGANFPHYVISGEGTILQVADERERARHAGINRIDRALYASGEWRRKISPAGLRLWMQRWPGVRSPLQLFPSRSVNDDYLGIELIPRPDATFSSEQYEALSELLHDVQTRHGIVLKGARLVGHEDLEPLSRMDSKGGWDPGATRSAPRFLWRNVFERLNPGIA